MIQSTQETKNLGKKFAKKLEAEDIILLEGKLGSGKTTFIKGVCNYFRVEESTVRSPTFTLINTYPTQKNKDKIKQIVHIDTYRMEDSQELIEIGFEDYLEDENSVIFIEWPEKIQELLEDQNAKQIKFKHLDKSKRKIIIN